jgi:Uma2 family endonuclease
MATIPKPFITPEEYLRRERAAEFKSEYFAGEVFAMSGGTLPHAQIATNIIGELHGCLKASPCRVVNSELRLLVPATGLYTYPDVMVICGEPDCSDGARDVVLNPILLVEVLSPKTQTYDRGDKFRNYRSIPTFKEYLIVAQDQALIEQWVLVDNRWTLLREFRNLEEVLCLAHVPATLALSEVYRLVTFQ